MKRIIFTITMFFWFIAFVNVNAQDNGHWNILNEWVDGDIDFVNNDIGWLAGYSTLFKTDDGGETWVSIPSEGYSEIYSIDFINESVGWAISYDDGSILKTENGGQSWVIQNESSVLLNSIYVVNDSTVFVGGDSSLILRTSDGGMSWQEQDVSLINKNYELLEILFVDSYTGFTLGYDYNNQTVRPIFRTIDGGNSWLGLPHYNYIFLGDLQFINDSTAFITATDQQWDNYYILETQDTCSSWSIFTQSKHIYSFKYLSDNTSYAIIWDEENRNRCLMKSADAGITWEKVLYFNNKSVSSIYFNRNSIGFVTTRNWGEIALYRTNEKGNNWVKKNMSYPFNDVYFIDKNKGFAVGGYVGFHGSTWGDVWFTADGGETWSKNSNHPQVLIKSGFFVNDSIGFTLGRVYRRGYVIHKTIDGGDSWENVTENPSDSTVYYFSQVNDLCFQDIQSGWLAGSFQDSLSSGAAIFSTNDNGDNWDLIWKYPEPEGYEGYGYSLNAICSFKTTAWAVGEYGLVTKYTEHDQWQLQTSFTDLPLIDVFFIDENHGWIAGGYFDEDNENLKFFRTKDGGQFWQDIPDFNFQVNDMFFEDSLHGWAVGNDTSETHNWNYRRGKGFLLETHNGGENWIALVEDLSASLTAIHFKDGYGWAVGGNGLVLRTENGINWVDQSSGKSYPNKFNLSQNYPNPFNPKTTISYQLPKLSEVDLSIYNLLGQKVVTLVSKKQTAGSYKVQWDATGFASGVYLYRIGTDKGYVKTRKLVLLK